VSHKYCGDEVFSVPTSGTKMMRIFTAILFIRVLLIDTVSYRGYVALMIDE
jgi:hypothetical protein